MERAVVIVLLAVWLGLCVDAAGIAMTEATGDGFTRGMDRAQAVLMRATAASLIAIAVWVVGRRLPAGWLRQASRVPLIVSGLAALWMVVRMGLALV